MFGESSVRVSIDGIACHGECMIGVCVYTGMENRVGDR